MTVFFPGDRPYKCSTCEKCFRVAGDLRRHMLTHEKVRNRFEEHKKAKDDKTKKIKEERDIKSEMDTELKSQPPNAHTKPILLKNADKKKPVKKNQIKKVGAPNVTVTGKDSEGQFKVTTDYANNELFDTRQECNKFKEVYGDDYKESFKAKEYSEPIGNFKESVQEREWAVLKPILRNNSNEESDKLVYCRTENTDGKMQVFTHVEKNTNIHTVTLNDLRNLERERGETVHGEPIENAFLERLAAIYNIST